VVVVYSNQSEGEVARQEMLRRSVKHLALMVPAVALAGGTAALPFDPRFGLLAAALILGWTQLVGL
jgi:hypothetical protein